MYRVPLSRAPLLIALVAGVFFACGSSSGGKTEGPDTGDSTGGANGNGAATGGTSSSGAAAGSSGQTDGSSGGVPQAGGGDSGQATAGDSVSAGAGTAGREGETVAGSAGASGSEAALGCGEIYANIVGVTATGSAGDYVFAVSVESADIDCNQYANWWEVLSATGTLLYRRILDHSHTDENGTSDPDAPGNTFTREGSPVPVAAADEVVIVRAHMSNGGYCGAIMRGSVAAGFEVATDLPPDFASGVETEDPQPDECLF